MKNANLHKSKRQKNDEFYTSLVDIERELQHYTPHFRDKVVYLNCDCAKESNFIHYFLDNFLKLGLKKLIATGYIPDMYMAKNVSTYLEYEAGGEFTLKKDSRTGDFRSEDSVALMETADIVVTNPPFSLFREYVAQLMKYKKKFLILGNMNAITYKEIFPLIKEEKVWLGVDNRRNYWFRVPEHYEIKTETRKKIVNGVQYNSNDNIAWYTNLDHSKRHKEMILFKKYKENEAEYPRYDNYDAINVDKVKDIPQDYDGVMGVPITFLDKHNPEQFEIVGKLAPKINGKNKYKRILIKKYKKK